MIGVRRDLAAHTTDPDGTGVARAVNRGAMTAVFGETRSMAQRDGPDVDVVVFGDEFYARYETVDGYSVVYDEQRGRFCYAVLAEGAFVSSGVPIDAARPANALLHGTESDQVRGSKSAAARARRFPSHKQ